VSGEDIREIYRNKTIKSHGAEEKIDCINAINPAKKTVFVKETHQLGGGYLSTL
jgi:hypothetical protein